MTHEEAAEWVRKHLRDSGWDEKRIIHPLRWIIDIRPDIDEWEMKSIFMAIYPNRPMPAISNRDKNVTLSVLWVIMCNHILARELERRIEGFGWLRKTIAQIYLHAAHGRYRITAFFHYYGISRLIFGE